MDRLTVLARPARCEYLPDRLAQLRYEFAPDVTREEYTERVQSGWRRFGAILFRPECRSCRMCQSLRVPVSTFTPSDSQRRAWKKNAGDVRIQIAEPSWSSQKMELFARFHEHGHETKGWPPNTDADPGQFIENPFPTEEWTYYLEDRLIGVGYVDVLAAGLSAIYFFWDPAERRRSLGTFNVLTIIEAARRQNLPHVYLGYYVEGCRSLQYKGAFRPNEILHGTGEWATANLLPADR